MKGIICTYLYPTTNERTLKSNTFAVRELVEGSIKYGLNIVAVVRFQPLITRAGIFWPRRVVVNGLPVYMVPKIGFRYTYSKALTKFILNTLGFSGEYEFGISHTCSSFEAMDRVLFSNIQRKYLVLHGSDFKNKQLLEHCVGRSTAVLCRSFPLENLLLKELGIKSKGILYSGVQCESLEEVGMKNLNIAMTIRIVMACVFTLGKNILQTLGAISRLKGMGYDLKVDLYGDGEIRSLVEERINNLNLTEEVSLHGFVPRSVVLGAMSEAHLFVMPSAPETFGLAYLEAMAAGCVAVGHRGWGIDGVVTDGVNGYLVDKPDEEGITGKLLAYIKLGEPEREKLHLNSAMTAQKYSQGSAYRNYAHVFMKLNQSVVV